jgi:hypothetical protein
MILRRLAVIVLFIFAPGLISTAAGAILHSLAREDQVNHSESSSCPDPCDNGNPCSPTCPCACCPGHSSAPAFVSVRPSLEAPPFHEHQASLPDGAVHPKDVLFRIYRPPRA